jgi:hypothetical protein
MREDTGQDIYLSSTKTIPLSLAKSELSTILTRWKRGWLRTPQKGELLLKAKRRAARPAMRAANPSLPIDDHRRSWTRSAARKW